MFSLQTAGAPLVFTQPLTSSIFKLLQTSAWSSNVQHGPASTCAHVALKMEDQPPVTLGQMCFDTHLGCPSRQQQQMEARKAMGWTAPLASKPLATSL